MKKLLSVLLAVLMLLSMATVAMAEGETTENAKWNMHIANGGTFNLTKVYTNGQYAPDEVFDFSITPKDSTNTLVPTIETKPSNKGGVLSSTITVKLPEYTKVGTYEYEMKEVAGSTKGVEYDITVRTLIVYVENKKDGGFQCQVALKKGTDKDDTFTNEYKDGTLVVKKTVESYIEADKDIDYNFTVKLTGVNAVNYAGTITRKAGSESETETVTFTGNNKGEASATFALKDAEYLTIEHLPQGAQYVVEEQTATPNESHNGSWTSSGLVSADDNKTIDAGMNTVEVKNRFEYKGTLVLRKTVTGNSGDMINDEFKFTVEIDKIFNCSALGSDKMKLIDNGKYEVTLKHGESVTLTDIPYGAVYTITEGDTGYKSKNTLTEKNKAGETVGTPTTTENRKPFRM